MTARALRWHVPPHLAMLGVMLFAMRPGAGTLDHLVGGLASAALAMVLAPLVRRHPEVQGVLLDLGAMTVVLVALAMAPTRGSHEHGPAAIAVAVLAVLTWVVARAACTRGRIAVATGAVSAVQLGGMLLLAS